MTLRQVYGYWFVVRDGGAACLAVDNPGGFEVQSIRAIVHPVPKENAEFVIQYGSVNHTIPALMLKAEFPFPVIPAVVLPQGSRITVRFAVLHKTWWGRFIAWFRPYEAQLVINGDNLFSAEDGMPVDVEWKFQNEE